MEWDWGEGRVAGDGVFADLDGPGGPWLTEGRVHLWAGWSLVLPTPCLATRNEDGSWSAWDKWRVVDVSILTTGGKADGSVVPPEEILSAPVDAPVRSANGCLSFAEAIEDDGEAGVTSLGVQAAAECTLMLCWVSYGAAEPAVHLSWAKQVWGSITHDPQLRD